MNGRIKQIRSESGLSMRAFAERIGISSGAVAHLEDGKNNPSERTVRAICSEFGVRRQWLEDGIEPMYQPEAEDDEVVDAVLAGDDEFVKAVIRGIAKTPGGWDTMRNLILAIQRELDKQQIKPEN